MARIESRLVANAGVNSMTYDIPYVLGVIIPCSDSTRHAFRRLHKTTVSLLNRTLPSPSPSTAGDEDQDDEETEEDDNDDSDDEYIDTSAGKALTAWNLSRFDLDGY